MNTYYGPKVVVIGLDGAAPEQLRQYLAEGRLPAMAAAIARSREVALRTDVELFVTSVWPSAASGRSVASHGVHAFRPLMSGTLEPNENRDFKMPVPFWETAARAGVATTVLDFPLYGPCAADNRLEHLHVVRWGPHPPQGAASASDPELAARLLSRHGLHPCTEDDETLHAIEDLTAIATRLIAGVHLRSAVVTDLIEWTRPEMLVVVFPEIHVAAHQFMNREAPDHPSYDPKLVARLGSPTRDTYEAVDQAVGRILDRLPPDATVVLFGVLGLQVTHGGGRLLHEVLVRLGLEVPARAFAPRRTLSALARLLPAPIDRRLRRRLAAIRSRPGHRPVGFDLDWLKTRAFALPWSHAGYLRVNLRGRERLGIVEPGAERDALLAEIEAVVRELKIAGTDEPAVERVVRVHEQFHGAAAADLPDLMVLWKNRRPIEAVESPAIGRVENRDRGPRCAHGPDGRMFVSGPLVADGPPIGDTRDIDIAPTILRLVGVAPPAGIDGRPIEHLFGRA